MRRVVAILLILGVTACATKPPVPEIQVKTADIAVPVPCAVDTKNQRPALMNLTQLTAALAAVSTVDERAKIVTNQLLAYIGWEPVVEAAMQGCSGAAPKP